MKQLKSTLGLVAFGILLASCNNSKNVTYQREFGEPCDEINNCSKEYICVTGICRTICISDDECGKKQHCKNNYCVANSGDECRKGWSGGACDVCAEGFFGANCQACPDCGSHGSCDGGLTGSGTCLCAEGWSGARCDECAENHFGENCAVCPDCHGHGECSTGLTGTGCVCSDQYSGDTCEQCAENHFGPTCQICQCGAHGECDGGLSGSGTCKCEDGFTDAHCDRCSDSRFTGQDCKECTDKRFSGQNCDECIDGATDAMVDRSGKSYKTVCINKQFWMAENLNDAYGTYYHINGSELNDDLYGLLYNWASALRVCPAGWYLPTYGEVQDMLSYLDKNGKSLNLDSCSGIDDSGLCVVPSGYYQAGTDKFSDVNSLAYLWTSSEKECSDYNRCAQSVYVGQSGATGTNGDSYAYQTGGAAVRCARNSCADNRYTGKNCDECVDGATDTLLDKAGKSYKTVCINGRFWMAQNMAYDNSSDVTCYANTKRTQDFKNKYGCLYTWTDAKKLCPDGWQLPAIDDIDELLAYIGNDERYANQALRAKDFNDGLDLYGLGLVDAGYYQYERYSEAFEHRNGLWLTDEDGDIYSYDLSYDEYSLYVSYAEKDAGYSVRCVESPKSCENVLFTGKNCDQCKNVRKTYASGCLECKNTLMTGDNCVTCKNGGYGDKCLSYGEAEDMDGNKYKTVVINGQEWMAENSRYDFGDVTCLADFQNLAGADCATRDECKKKYGCLYSFADITTVDICPEGDGWRLPTNDDLKALLKFVGDNEEKRSAALRAASFNNGDDLYGFSALPVGYHYPDQNGGYYTGFGSTAAFWTSTAYYPEHSSGAHNLIISGGWAADSNFGKTDGYSVRCVRDLK